jgi:hypothetical protein
MTNNKVEQMINLEALAMDDGGTRLVVLLLGDPQLLEGGERGQDGATNPDRVLALRGVIDDLDLHGGGSSLMDSSSLHTEERGLEEGLRATESLVSDGDNLTIRQLIALLKGRGGGSSLHLLLKVKSNKEKHEEEEEEEEEVEEEKEEEEVGSEDEEECEEEEEDEEDAGSEGEEEEREEKEEESEDLFSSTC